MTVSAMSMQDRTLLAVAGVSGCISVWLVFQSVTQWTLSPTASPSNLMFLAMVTGTITALLVTRQSQRGRGQTLDGPPRPQKVNQRLLLMVGAVAAMSLLVISRLVDGMADTGEATITMAPEASLAGFGGVGVLAILVKLMLSRR